MQPTPPHTPTPTRTRRQWDEGRGAHHPDYDPEIVGPDVVKASRATVRGGARCLLLLTQPCLCLVAPARVLPAGTRAPAGKPG